MNLGHRSFWAIVRAPFKATYWLGLVRLARVFTNPATALYRYVTSEGSYPWEPTLRTPAGVIKPTLHSHHDVRTVNEIFCRLDYGDGDGATVVVDMGANIGISALFFLTRRVDARVYCFEPDPKNLERLRANVAAFTGRVVINPVAVMPASGRVTFVTEPSGRYGHVDRGSADTVRPHESRIEVSAVAISEALRSVLDVEGRIDVVKIDTEGNEPDLVAAIPDELLGRIGHIYFEDNQASVVHLTNRP